MYIQSFEPDCHAALVHRIHQLPSALWKSNHCRCLLPLRDVGRFYTDGTLGFCQLYLRYQDTRHGDATIETDDSSILESNFTYCDAYPPAVTGCPLELSNAETPGVKGYFDSETYRRCAVEYFGQHWIQFVCEKSSWEDFAKIQYKIMLAKAPEHVHSMAKACSGGERYGHVCIALTHFPISLIRPCCADFLRRVGEFKKLVNR